MSPLRARCLSYRKKFVGRWPYPTGSFVLPPLQNGWYIHSCNFIFHECPRCNGASLGCECERGLIAVPREQLQTGEWVTFGEQDDQGCVEITNLTDKEAGVQAMSEGYPR